MRSNTGRSENLNSTHNRSNLFLEKFIKNRPQTKPQLRLTKFPNFINKTEKEPKSRVKDENHQRQNKINKEQRIIKKTYMNSYISVNRISSNNIISLQNLNGISLKKENPQRSPILSLQSQFAPSRKGSFGEGICLNFDEWKQNADQTGPLQSSMHENLK